MNEYLEKIEKIEKWAKDKKGKLFDTNFVRNVKHYIEDNDFIGEKQKEAIDNIIEKFKII